MPLAGWLDAVYVILLEAPSDDALRKAADQLVNIEDRVAPNRETWGLRPEHQERQARLTGMAADGQAPK